MTIIHISLFIHLFIYHFTSNINSKQNENASETGITICIINIIPKIKSKVTANIKFKISSSLLRLSPLFIKTDGGVGVRLDYNNNNVTITLVGILFGINDKKMVVYKLFIYGNVVKKVLRLLEFRRQCKIVFLDS